MSFTPEQTSIIEHKSNQLRVIAVPGSGKTTTIIARVIHLLKTGIAPENILVICFARHDKENLTQKLKKDVDSATLARLRIFNYHGWGLNFIRSFGLYDKEGPHIKLLKESESRNIIRSCLEKIVVRRHGETELAKELFTHLKKSKTIDSIFGLFDDLRDSHCVDLLLWSRFYQDPSLSKGKELIESLVEDTQKTADKLPFQWREEVLLLKEDIIEIASFYGEFCKEFGYVDYMDMILQPYIKLLREPELAKSISLGIHHLLVDEFQDISFLQFKLVCLLSKENKGIFSVGDLDQTLYTWRNARPEYMKDELPRLFSNLVTLPLSINFRSDGNIIDIANKLIVHNKERLPLVLQAFHPKKESVKYVSLQNPFEQADRVVEIIKKLITPDMYFTKGEHKIAIVLRSVRSVSANLIKNALFKAGIPVASRMDSTIIERIMDKIVSICNLVVDPNSPSDLRALIEMQPGFGAKSLDQLADLLSRHSLAHIIEKKLMPKSKVPLIQEIQSFVRENHEAYLANPDITIQDLDFLGNFDLKNIFMKYFVGKDDDTAKVALTTVLEELKQNKSKFNDYRDQLSAGLLINSEARERGEKPSVLISTAHRAKGGEWDIVICPDVVAGSGGYPTVRGGSINEEERRIFYVAITRARKILYIMSYYATAQRVPAVPSVFIKEMGLNNRSMDYTSQMLDRYRKKY